MRIRKQNTRLSLPLEKGKVLKKFTSPLNEGIRLESARDTGGLLKIKASNNETTI